MFTKYSKRDQNNKKKNCRALKKILAHQCSYHEFILPRGLARAYNKGYLR